MLEIIFNGQFLLLKRHRIQCYGKKKPTKIKIRQEVSTYSMLPDSSNAEADQNDLVFHYFLR